MSDQRNIVVVQQGARRNYVYARQLEQIGRLKFLVTDIAAAEGARDLKGRFLAQYSSRRVVTGISAARLISCPTTNLFSVLKSLAHEERVFPVLEEVFGYEALLKPLVRSIGSGDVIVNYMGNGGPLLRFAKRRGARIITDFIITPLYLEIESTERQRWPGWEKDTTSPRLRAYYKRRMESLLALSDIYLCPSQTVARDLATLKGFDLSKVRLVPYGVSGVLLRPTNTEIGRVLFAGAAGLRKGLPYLAQAATLLKVSDPHIKIVVAGSVDAAIAARPEVRDIHFLGHLGREAVADEFARGDVFCLPSLAEGSATSIYEALANGVPVVTTASSGSVVSDSIQGFITPERDGAALATRLAQIVNNRNLRKSMAASAFATAHAFGDEACGQIFLDVVNELTP